MSGARKSEAREPDREALIAQLEYLVIEVGALQPLLEDLPRVLLEARPMDEPSILEAFVSMAHRDRQVTQLVEPGGHSGDMGGDGDDGASAILDSLREARQQLVRSLKGVDEAAWDAPIDLEDGSSVQCETLVQNILRQDLETLRAMGERLRTARLGETHRPGLM